VLGAGVIAGGIILGAWGGFRRRIVTTITGGVMAGLGILLVAFAPANAFWFALGGFALSGVSMAFIDGPIFALMQANVAPEMQGRVMSFLMSAGKLATPFALLIAGPVADLAGIRFWFYLAGAGGVLVHLAGAAVPAILTIEEQSKDIGVAA
jgi:DHA3 family macrolide efflux protein-like MFS transporter